MNSPDRAVRLLARIGVDDALIGDVIEQRNAGRSGAWLCVQGVAAVVTSVLADVRRHPVRAVAVVLCGLVLREAHRALWSVLWHYANLGMARTLPLGFMPLGVTLSWLDLLMAIPGWMVMGWLLARLSGPTLVVAYIVVSAILIAPDLWRQASNALDDVPFRPYFYIATARETLFTLNVMIGALLFRRQHAIK